MHKTIEYRIIDRSNGVDTLNTTNSNRFICHVNHLRKLSGDSEPSNVLSVNIDYVDKKREDLRILVSKVNIKIPIKKLAPEETYENLVDKYVKAYIAFNGYSPFNISYVDGFVRIKHTKDSKSFRLMKLGSFEQAIHTLNKTNKEIGERYER